MPRHRFTDTRDRIEQAAVRLFVEKGVAETTVRDIARAVGLSEGALYRHFESKDELVWKAFERHYVAFAATLRRWPTASRRARQGRGDDSRLLPRARREPHAVQVPAVRAARTAREARARTPTPVDVMRAVLDKAIAAREIPAQRPDLATALVFGVVLQPVTFAAYGGCRSISDSMCERLVAACVGRDHARSAEAKETCPCDRLSCSC